MDMDMCTCNHPCLASSHLSAFVKRLVSVVEKFVVKDR